MVSNASRMMKTWGSSLRHFKDHHQQREVWIPLKDRHCRYHRKYFQAELGLQDTATRQHLHGLGTKPRGCIVTNLNLELRSIPKSWHSKVTLQLLWGTQETGKGAHVLSFKYKMPLPIPILPQHTHTCHARSCVGTWVPINDIDCLEGCGTFRMRGCTEEVGHRKAGLVGYRKVPSVPWSLVFWSTRCKQVVLPQACMPPHRMDCVLRATG